MGCRVAARAGGMEAGRRPVVKKVPRAGLVARLSLGALWWGSGCSSTENRILRVEPFHSASEAPPGQER